MRRIYVVTVEGRRRYSGWCSRHGHVGGVYATERCPSDHAPEDRLILEEARKSRATARAARACIIERALLDAIAERYALQSCLDGSAWFDAIDREDEAKAAYLAHVHPGVPWRRVLGLS